MRNRHTSLCIGLLCLSAGMLLSACDTSTTDAPAKPQAQGKAKSVVEPTVSVTPPAVADSVAMVNGVPITRIALRQAMSRSPKGTPVSPVSPQQALNELVDIELLRQEALRRGMDKRPEIVAEIAYQRASVLSSHLLHEVLTSSEITDEDLRREYAVQLAALPQTQYHLEHILVEDEQAAKAIVTALGKGETFADLARDKSTDNSANKGGDIGWLPRNSLIPALAEVVDTLKAGAVSAPVQSKFGWHLLHLVATRKVEKPSFESVRKTLLNSVALQRSKEFIRTLRSQATIAMTPASAPAQALSPVVEGAAGSR